MSTDANFFEKELATQFGWIEVGRGKAQQKTVRKQNYDDQKGRLSALVTKGLVCPASNSEKGHRRVHFDDGGWPADWDGISPDPRSDIMQPPSPSERYFGSKAQENLLVDEFHKVDLASARVKAITLRSEVCLEDSLYMNEQWPIVKIDGR